MPKVTCQCLALLEVVHWFPDFLDLAWLAVFCLGKVACVTQGGDQSWLISRPLLLTHCRTLPNSLRPQFSREASGFECPVWDSWPLIPELLGTHSSHYLSECCERSDPLQISPQGSNNEYPKSEHTLENISICVLQFPHLHIPPPPNGLSWNAAGKVPWGRW